MSFNGYRSCGGIIMAVSKKVRDAQAKVNPEVQYEAKQAFEFEGEYQS